MRVLHLTTQGSGGSYEYAALLSGALAQQGIESPVLCKNSTSAETGRLLLDRLVRPAYVSFSAEPWHGTRRLLSPPTVEDMEGVDVVHVHTMADWFDFPAWLETLPKQRARCYQPPRTCGISPDAAFFIVDAIVTRNRHTPAGGVIGAGQNDRRRTTPGEDLLVRIV
jgi:hypothetical protein